MCNTPRYFRFKGVCFCSFTPTLWSRDVGVVQRVDDPGVILTEGQVFDQMGHVNLQKGETPVGHRLQPHAQLHQLTLSKPKLCRS